MINLYEKTKNLLNLRYTVIPKNDICHNCSKSIYSTLIKLINSGRGKIYFHYTYYIKLLIMENSIWDGAVALVTGGGSGIGRQLSLAMSQRGTKVIVTDVNAENAAKVAAECGSEAEAFALDVRDANAFTELVNKVYEKHKRIDFLFNNAGIGVGGETYEIGHELWDRIIDINIKGVLNGVLAAYPIMIKQGYGHIINTASLAGLGPAPLLAPYSLTKHAVVGLSTSLRIEAVKFGVKVSVLCPAAIETPILDSNNPTDLPAVPWTPDMRRFLTKLAGPPYPVEKLAEEALAALEKNKPVIVIPGRARAIWILGRLFPSLVFSESLKAVAAERTSR
jgi:NAD(P)-dependent dehydrogenase (short-subunit alcohol dehydrogenase family)